MLKRWFWNPPASRLQRCAFRRALCIGVAVAGITTTRSSDAQGLVIFQNYGPTSFSNDMTLTQTNFILVGSFGDGILNFTNGTNDWTNILSTNGVIQAFMANNTWASGVNILTFQIASWNNASMVYAFPPVTTWPQPSSGPPPNNNSGILDFVPPVPTRGHVGQSAEWEVSAPENSQLLTMDFLAGSYNLSIQPGSTGTGIGIVFGGYPLVPTPQSTVALGTVTAPPYRIAWIPNSVGTWFVWAKATNDAGGTYQTPQARLDVYAENDDFAHALEVSPGTLTTNFAYSSHWASAETNEPLHQKNVPALRSLWWKWTPSYSGRVRLKAVRSQAGLPLEIFTGDSLENLRRIADNRGQSSVLGFSGIVQLKVKAGQTYYFRTDDLSVLPVSVAGISLSPAPDTAFVIEPSSAPLPGELNFSLIGGGFTDRRGSPHVIPLARVLQTDRRTPLVGSQYRAQLYVGTSPRNLLPAGNPQPFYDSSYVAAYPSFAGIFPPVSVLLPDAVPHQRLFAQIRVWDASFGASFEAARDNGSPVGSSKIIPVAAGSEASGGSMLFGMQTFALRASQVSTP